MCLLEALVNKVTLLAIGMLVCMVCASSSYALDGKSSGEMNFLFCDIGNNDDALVEVRIKKTEKEADSRIGIYNLKSKKLYLITPETQQNWSSPRFSADASKVVFSIHRSADELSVGILDLRSKLYKEIRSGQKMKIRPAFSFDEHSVYYWAPGGEKRKYSGKPFFALFSQDVAERSEVQRTPFTYIAPGHVVPLPDNKTIVLGSMTLSLAADRKTNGSMASSVVIDKAQPMKLAENHVLTTYGDNAQVLSGSATGTILLSAVTNRNANVGGYFAYNVCSYSNGNVVQLTGYVPGKDRVIIRHAAISRDGKRFIFESVPSVPRDTSYGFFGKLLNADVSKPTLTDFGTFLGNIDGSGMTRITIASPFTPVVVPVRADSGT